MPEVMALEKPYRYQELIKTGSQPETLTKESDEAYNFRIWSEKVRKITEEAKQPVACVRCGGMGNLPDFSECPMCGGCGSVISFYTVPF